MNFNGPMKGTCFTLTNFAMSWKGSITNIQGGVESSSIDIAGFKGSMKKLYFVKDSSCSGGYCITLDECMIRLPENAGSLERLFSVLIFMLPTCILSLKNAIQVQS